MLVTSSDDKFESNVTKYLKSIHSIELAFVLVHPIIEYIKVISNASLNNYKSKSL